MTGLAGARMRTMGYRCEGLLACKTGSLARRSSSQVRRTGSSRYVRAVPRSRDATVEATARRAASLRDRVSQGGMTCEGDVLSLHVGEMDTRVLDVGLVDRERKPSAVVGNVLASLVQCARPTLRIASRGAKRRWESMSSRDQSWCSVI